MGYGVKIAGLQKMSLLDYPGKICATVFLGGCNLRCPFCHNASLVLPEREGDVIPEDELFDFLARRLGLIDGVCVTGGEPLFSPDTVRLLGKIRGMGYPVKLDTNGTFPERLAAVIDGGLVNYVAMDIKNSLRKYPETTGIGSFDIGNVIESADIIMSSGIEYEFRTTIVRELHTIDDISQIGAWLKGAERYYLQSFRDSGDNIREGFHACSEDEMETFAETARKYFKQVEIRGMG